MATLFFLLDIPYLEMLRRWQHPRGLEKNIVPMMISWCEEVPTFSKHYNNRKAVLSNQLNGVAVIFVSLLCGRIHFHFFPFLRWIYSYNTYCIKSHKYSVNDQIAFLPNPTNWAGKRERERERERESLHITRLLGSINYFVSVPPLGTF